MSYGEIRGGSVETRVLELSPAILQTRERHLDILVYLARLKIW